jgi:hypothetical protein
MQAANTAFERMVQQKNELTANNNVPSSNQCRRRMVKYLKPLLGYLEILAELEPKIYAGAATRISEEIDYVMTGARARQTRREKLEPEPTPFVEPDTPAEL